MQVRFIINVSVQEETFFWFSYPTNGKSKFSNFQAITKCILICVCCMRCVICRQIKKKLQNFLIIILYSCSEQTVIRKQHQHHYRNNSSIRDKIKVIRIPAEPCVSAGVDLEIDLRRMSRHVFSLMDSGGCILHSCKIIFFFDVLKFKLKLLTYFFERKLFVLVTPRNFFSFQ